MIQGSRGARTFLSASGINPRLIVEASGFHRIRDGGTGSFGNARSSVSAACLDRIGFYLNPRIPPALVVDGHVRRWEREVREGACRDSDGAGDRVDAPEHRGTAFRAKPICDAAATVADTNEFSRLPFNQDVFLAKPGAKTKCAAGFPLASQAVAHCNADGFSNASGRKLAARALSSTSGHSWLLRVS